MNNGWTEMAQELEQARKALREIKAELDVVVILPGVPVISGVLNARRIATVYLEK